ncbi:Methylenetetrahydrofolate dehydrogenase / Methenyltetrahydrofolate cyclohydrolase [Alphaproteobacteria bacterium]
MTGVQATLIDGKMYAAQVLVRVQREVQYLKQNHDVVPGLAVVMVGDNEASKIYVNLKVKRAAEVGITSYLHRLDANTSEWQLIELLEELNAQQHVHGILLQLPLPPHIDTFKALNTIHYKKDVDCFTIHNVGLLHSWKPILEPCTPQGIMILLKNTLEDFNGKKAVVIGRSIVVGRPIAAMLLRENCSVTILHSYSHNIDTECASANILITAVGHPSLVKKEWVKPGACVIDVGTSKVDGKICGDVDFAEVSKIPCYITPVPGGVGPMTVACLLSNTIKALCHQHNIALPEIQLPSRLVPEK